MMTLLNDFYHLFFPNVCVVCGNSLVQGEEKICYDCLGDMPLTHTMYHDKNEVERRFYGKVEIERACSLFRFQKGGSVQRALHALKYKNQPEVGYVLGQYLGNELIKSNNYRDVQCITPVPLHWRKEKIRGYNQSYHIALGLSERIGLPIYDNIIKIKENETQTKKGVFERWQNTLSVYQVKDVTLFQNNHILIVDDVLTTGSTLEACAHSILQVEGTKVSIATLALA